MVRTVNERKAAPLPNPEYLPFLSVSEREAIGKQLRDEVPLERHAECSALPERADPIDILEEQASLRSPDLVPIRHGRMASSAFAFYRGGTAIMAGDLASSPTATLRAQLCGDAHLLNFGIFETPERNLIFGINDFDETIPGPIDWDVKRLAASVEIAGRDLGFDHAGRREAVRATVRSYRQSMLEFAAQRTVDVWYAKLPAKQLCDRLADLADRRSSKEAVRRVRQALNRDHLRAFDRLVVETDQGARFLNRPPVLTPIEELLDDEQRARFVDVVREFLQQYRASLTPDRRVLIESYRFEHMARKVVGVGSVGTRCWVVLLVGRDHSDPLLLQLKEAQASVLAPFAGPTLCKTNGQRVVEGQRLMQAASDSMLGWYQVNAWDGRSHDFYVRQLWDGKASIDVARLSPKGLRVYGESCGWTLARGHARSGDRIAMAAYLGHSELFDDAVTSFSADYADQNESDHRRFVEAVESGRLEAKLGV